MGVGFLTNPHQSPFLRSRLLSPQAESGHSSQTTLAGTCDIFAMISPAERLHIAEDLISLRKAYDSVTDYGIREVIQGWILDAEEALEKDVKKHS